MTRQYYTEKARAAAAESRRRRLVIKTENKDRLEVFVVRVTPPDHYAWEIRKYGAFIIETSVGSFDSQVDAREAGQASLARERN